MKMINADEDHLYRHYRSPGEDGALGVMSKWGASFYEFRVCHRTP